MNTITIISTRSAKAWFEPCHKFRTNSNHVVSVIEYQGGYEIVVFAPWGGTEQQEWLPTVDDMMRKFSQLVAQYTLKV